MGAAKVWCVRCGGTANLVKVGTRMEQSMSRETFALCVFPREQGGDPVDCPHMVKAIKNTLATKMEDDQ